MQLDLCFVNLSVGGVAGHDPRGRPGLLEMRESSAGIFL